MQAGEATEVDGSGLAHKSRTSNGRLVLVRDATCIRLPVRQSRGQHRTHADVVKEVRSLKHTYMSAVKRELLFTELC